MVITEIRIPFEASDARELAKSRGARWDRDAKTWRVPTQHAAEVRAAISGKPFRSLDMSGRVDVKIPFRATAARELAKRRGARWHAETKAWAVPAAHADEVRDAIFGEVCVGEPCECTGAQIWEGECLLTGASAY